MNTKNYIFRAIPPPRSNRNSSSIFERLKFQFLTIISMAIHDFTLYVSQTIVHRILSRKTKSKSQIFVGESVFDEKSNNSLFWIVIEFPKSLGKVEIVCSPQSILSCSFPLFLSLSYSPSMYFSVYLCASVWEHFLSFSLAQQVLEPER